MTTEREHSKDAGPGTYLVAADSASGSAGVGEIEALDRLLAGERIPVRESFPGQVMARLPEPSWDKVSLRCWWLSAAVLAALVTAAVLLLRGGSATVLEAALSAVGDLLVATLAAGAGILVASWRGLATGMTTALGASRPALALLGALVLALHVVLFRVVRRRSARRATTRSRR